MAIIQFETGQRVKFDGNPTPQDVEEVANRLGINKPTKLPSQKGLLGIAKDIGIGFAKGAGRSALNLAKLGEQINPLRLTPLGEQIAQRSLQNIQRLEQPLQLRTTAEKVGGGLETAAEFILPGIAGKEAVGESLINTARRLYQSALKPSTALPPEEVSKTVEIGLQEGISLSKRGIDNLANKIDNLETALDAPIREAAQAGKKIFVQDLRPYINDAKTILGKTIDPTFSERAVQNIETRFEALQKKFPNGISIDEAQALKKNTYQLIKKAYGKLSTSTLEFQKQAARGLKEGIIEAVPTVGKINERLKNLYQFEQAIDKAANRVANRDIIGLGTKVLLAGEGKISKGIGILNEIFGPAGKSFTAIQANKLGRFLVTKSSNEITALKSMAKYVTGVDLVNLIQGISDSLKGQSESQQ